MEKNIVIVDEGCFKKNLSIFHGEGCKVIRTFVEDDKFKDDPMHKKLRQAKKKASDAFYNYEFDKRTNHKY